MIISDDFCSFWIKTLCCDPSSEPSRRDVSDEGSQHMVLMRNKKNYHKREYLMIIFLISLQNHML